MVVVVVVVVAAAVTTKVTPVQQHITITKIYSEITLTKPTANT